MGKKELSGRGNWQEASGPAGKSRKAERFLYEAFALRFEGTDFRIDEQPRDFDDIYKSVSLPEKLAESIYRPEAGYGRHGIVPDYAIRNLQSGKSIYVEVKRQDGWVEGKSPSAGRGNAHERCCKYFSPGLLRILHAKSHLEGEEFLPFLIVFQGDITRDPKRVREISLWFGKFEGNFFLWQDAPNPGSLLEHFDRHIRRHLL